MIPLEQRTHLQLHTSIMKIIMSYMKMFCMGKSSTQIYIN